MMAFNTDKKERKTKEMNKLIIVKKKLALPH